MAAPLRIAGISKQYGDLTALTDVSFTIGHDQILGIVGPNGSGKTTLCECLGGVLPADTGDALQSDRRLTTGERRRTFFYLPDAITPWPARTLRWALDFAIGFLGGRASLYDEVVGRLNLDALLNLKIGALSKGQRKRALLAIGLLAPQPVLVADEPFDGLDLRQSRDMAASLRAFAARGRTMVLSIHQMADAARVCDRLLFLSSGRTCGEGTIDELAALAAARRGRPVPPGVEELFLALT